MAAVVGRGTVPADLVPFVQVLDARVPQMESVLAVFQEHFVEPDIEQEIKVPKTSAAQCGADRRHSRGCASSAWRQLKFLDDFR